MTKLEIRSFNGHEARKYAHQIADMRISMFKEYPYLYDGSTEYEIEYLETYFKSENAVVLLVFDNDNLVGFSNVIPLIEETDEIKRPFMDNNLDLTQYVYIGEVMLVKPYRGRGLLRKFFDHHENYARNEGYSYLTLATSKRPKNHPMRPKDYKELDPIWGHFGYQLIRDLIARITWKQIDTGEKEENELNFWVKHAA